MRSSHPDGDSKFTAGALVPNLNQANQASATNTDFSSE